MKTFLFIILAEFFIAFCASHIVHSSMLQNYTGTVLRLAKAAHIKAYMNENTQPCDDFYKFTCDKWHRLHPARELGSKTTYLEQLQDLYVQKSTEMLKTAVKYDTSADTTLKNFYNSCRLQSGDIEAEWQVILNLVNFIGGWPDMKQRSWYETDYDWLKVVAELRRKLGLDIFIGLDIKPDFVDKNLHRIIIGAPGLELGSRIAYTDSEYTNKREQYRYRISKKLLTFFPHMSYSWVDEVASQVLEIETQLAKGLPQNTNLTTAQLTRERSAIDLSNAYGNYVDISRYLKIVFGENIYLQVYETPEDYLSNLVEVIKKTPKLTIANYTIWRVIDFFDASIKPQHEKADIWCVHQVEKFFPNQLQSLFHRSYNSMQMINEVQSTWADIKKVFRESLQASELLHWMTLETRQKAILKLDAIELQFRSHNETNLIIQLHGLTLHREYYYRNMIKVLQWQSSEKLSQLFKDPETRDTEIKLPTYQLTTNKIHIPIAFLQTRFFWDPLYPEAIKYGTLGFLLAKEMLHGFDMTGRKYDKYGYRNNWWDSSSAVSFTERTHCLKAQFINKGNFSTDYDFLTTISETGALRIAFRAYLNWWRNSAGSQAYSMETLPLLDYTQYQLFFIGYAQMWCTDYQRSIKLSQNFPEKLQVNGAVSNSVDFSREFKCNFDNIKIKKCSIY